MGLGLHNSCLSFPEARWPHRLRDFWQPQSPARCLGVETTLSSLLEVVWTAWGLRTKQKRDRIKDAWGLLNMCFCRTRCYGCARPAVCWPSTWACSRLTSHSIHICSLIWLEGGTQGRGPGKDRCAPMNQKGHHQATWPGSHAPAHPGSS